MSDQEPLEPDDQIPEEKNFFNEANGRHYAKPDSLIALRVKPWLESFWGPPGPKAASPG